MHRLSGWSPRGRAAARTGLVLSVLASAAGSAAEAARLELTNLHTGETLTMTLESGQAIEPQQLASLAHLLRDYRRNETHWMDPRLYVMLVDFARTAGCPARYVVISGYRAPATNAQLRAAGHAVAEHSQHIEGRAVDVRPLGCSLERFRDVALAARQGGVGYYPRSNFVHIDTGRVRSWQE